MNSYDSEKYKSSSSLTGFKIIKQDETTQARLGKFSTGHGQFKTPAFFPVATQAAVKGLSSEDLSEIGIEGLLSNAYHLYLRPGLEVIKQAGGLHSFMNFNKPIITDSGGYQIFSLASLRKVSDSGVTFQSHLDGRSISLTPEQVIKIQLDLGSDIVVPLDECVKYPVDHSLAAESVRRTIDWAKKSKDYFEANNRDEALFFGIIQGSTYPDLRKQCLEAIAALGLDGLCIGGLSVGEPHDLRYNILSFIGEFAEKTLLRYFMGSGKPPEIIEAISLGVDLFDCVVPTRYGRTGTAFTDWGEIVVRNAPCTNDFSALDKNCRCRVCENYSRAYLRHLVNVKEMLGVQLITYHNIFWYRNFIDKIRTAISEDRFSEFKKDFLTKYKEK